MIKRALLSVSDKAGLGGFAAFLHGRGVELISTGGTARALRDGGMAVTDIADYTGFPEIMDGRVKTLHPKVHGALLGRRDAESHRAAMQAHGMAPIDLVVVNLYPFERTVKSGANVAECIEQIDIGGPSMIRSAAKNHADVTVVTDPADYARVQAEIERLDGATSPELRRELAGKAFARTAAYDSAIAAWFARLADDAFPATLPLSATLKQALHYGENPHQRAAFYALDESGLSTAVLAQGERLSYNNFNDASAALELAAEFTAPAVVIVKHANPCGVAAAPMLEEAYRRALACDPVSAYGGIIAVNRPVDAAFAQALGKLFVEVLVAPSAEPEALALLKTRKKLRLLLTGPLPPPSRFRMSLRSVAGGVLYQEEDRTVLDEASLRVVTRRQPSPSQLEDLRFAFTVAKHVKSNAIVLVKDHAAIGIGAGQMSRIDSTRIACWKAREAGLSTQGAALASDAFFPFPDNVKLAAEAGIAAIIQPGGSIRDAEVIAAADQAEMAMIFTGVRHFRH
ncbi:MAG: bifunctional phosphoribosylaminoimidazolecarboxamide formyltransferase/IMP cyclohydrolase [Alphaproteobacteria bacterium]|nr:bifunctional phosphoribosylaminoimidazolecarboxamide formyltransferase/IMP cyclohydrolase [Alphaproteobacteria bacterium]